ncbi:hypothetical protein OG21DRAFT_1513983 [Imleria badia]|nr:hypothetical protein OG21DRAFT_1513983 [Imleria badia]
MNQPGSPPPFPPRLTYMLGFEDDLFDHWDCGVDMTLSSFCNKLHSMRSKAFNYGIAPLQHRKGPCTNEFLILDIVPLIPGTINPRTNPSHTYLKVSRSEDHAGSSFIWRRAKDDVILRQEVEAAVSQGSWYPASEHIATLAWEKENFPTLLDMFSLITFLSVSLPYYNRFTCQSNWLVRTVYVESLTEHHAGPRGFEPRKVILEPEAPASELWKIVRFIISIPSQLLAPDSPVGMTYFCAHMFRWSYDAKRQLRQYLEGPPCTGEI